MSAAFMPPTLNEPPRPRATLGRLARLTLKELREILRDRRTIVTLVLMPLLVYPLLSIGFRQFFLTHGASQLQPTYRIGFASEGEGQWFRTFLAEHGAELKEAAEDGGIDLDSTPRVKYYVFDDLAASVRNGQADLGIRLRDLDPAEWEQFRTLALDAEFLVAEKDSLGEKALELVQKAVATANLEFIQRRLTKLGVRQRADPIRVERVEIAAGFHAPGVSLLTALPLILILMTITGAVYPAIDLTAGERERGTLEILVAAPVPRLGLLMAKYVSVLTVALLTATINLATMSVTVFFSGLGPLLVGERGLSPLVVAEIFALLVLFAAFFSALLLSLTSFARSFKEAQAYLIPLMLLSLAPGLMSMIPGLELRGFLAVAPLINIVLLGRDLLERTVNPLMAVIVVASTFLYAGAAIAAAAKVFGSEDVLFNVQSSWSDWFRRPQRPRPAPTVPSALFCLALLFPTLFVLASALGQLSDWPISTRLFLQGVATALLFAGFPLAAAWMRRDPVRSAFQLYQPPYLSLVAAVLMGVSLWPFAHELVVWQHELGLATLNESHFERVRALMIQAREQASLFGLLVSMALLPGICEEFFFRGYLFRALRTQLSGRGTVIAAALLFGGFHLITDYALAVERFLPSTLLGVILGWVCLRTGSVIPGMLLHVVHNGLLLVIAWHEPWLRQHNLGVAEQAHLPLTWLAGSLIVAIAGAALMRPREERLSAAGDQLAGAGG